MNINPQKATSIILVMLLFSGFIPILVSTDSFMVEPQKHFSPSAFTWQTFNRNMNVTTFVSPDGSHDALWHYLNGAKESIYVEIYGINNPYILDLFHELHATKPSLEVKFLLGDGSLGYYAQNDNAAYNLTQLGYPVRWTSDTEFVYAHQKFVIIDNKTTIVQAGNWAKTSFPEAGKIANREWNIAMTDIDVTEYYRNVFDYDWTNGRDYDSVADGIGSPFTYSETGSSYPRPFAFAGEFAGDMNVTPIFSPDTSLQGILYCINAAQVSLDIQIPYFTNWNETGSVEQILDAIIAAKNRGVSVRVITEEKYDYEEVANLFHEHNIPIVIQDPTWFAELHNKGIIVDGRIVLVSSINYSDNSIENNREAGVIIENADIAQWYLEVFDFDWSIAEFHFIGHVNLDWNPNIPTSSSAIDVTVYGHDLFDDGITSVSLGVKIGSGAWNNYSITGTVFASAEGDLENFIHTIPAQADGTNITVQASIEAGGVWYVGEEMVIHVRDSIGSVITTTPTPPPIDPTLADLLPYIAIAVVIAIVGIILKKRR